MMSVENIQTCYSNILNEYFCIYNKYIYFEESKAHYSKSEIKILVSKVSDSKSSLRFIHELKKNYSSLKITDEDSLIKGWGNGSLIESLKKKSTCFDKNWWKDQVRS